MGITREILDNRIREMPLRERLDKCKSMIGEMCSKGRPPKMTIPPQWTDEDMFIITSINDAMKILESIEIKKCNHKWSKSNMKGMLYCVHCDEYKPEGM